MPSIATQRTDGAFLDLFSSKFRIFQATLGHKTSRCASTHAPCILSGHAIPAGQQTAYDTATTSAVPQPSSFKAPLNFTFCGPHLSSWTAARCAQSGCCHQATHPLTPVQLPLTTQLRPETSRPRDRREFLSRRSRAALDVLFSRSKPKSPRPYFPVAGCSGHPKSSLLPSVTTLRRLLACWTRLWLTLALRTDSDGSGHPTSPRLLPVASFTHTTHATHATNTTHATRTTHTTHTTQADGETRSTHPPCTA